MRRRRHDTDRERKALRAALADYGRAIQLQPHSVEAYFGRGRIHHALADYPAALADYQRALELDPYYGDALCNTACAYALQGQTALACEWLRRALGINRKYLELCRDDPDFDSIRQTPEFQAIEGVGG